MGNKHTQVRAQSSSGNSLQLTEHETDSPILPVAQLEQLHQFRPDLVDWVKNQTEAEAIHRRARENRVDLFILIERMGGLVAGTMIAGVGLAIAAYVGLHGQPVLAGVLGGGTLVGIVAVLVTGKQRSKTPQQALQSGKGKAK
jgi:hypothetical protein